MNYLTIAFITGVDDFYPRQRTVYLEFELKPELLLNQQFLLILRPNAETKSHIRGQSPARIGETQ